MTAKIILSVLIIAFTSFCGYLLTKKYRKKPGECSKESLPVLQCSEKKTKKLKKDIVSWKMQAYYNTYIHNYILNYERG